MSEKITENILLQSTHNRPFLADVTYLSNSKPKPIVLFVHGFKGFKDWGHFNLVAQYFAKQHFVFYKFNMSHNGTTVDNPHEFSDLSAFGNNNFTKELADIGTMLDYIEAECPIVKRGEANANEIYLIGHSRGGAVSIIKAQEDARIKALATWAAVNNFAMGYQNEAMIAEWREKGVQYVFNSRTNQQMPLHFQIYEDYMANTERLNPVRAMQQLQKPTLILHGDEDETVPVKHATELAQANPEAELHIVKGANHVFGASHPFNDDDLPAHTYDILNKTVTFFQKLI